MNLFFQFPDAFDEDKSILGDFINIFNFLKNQPNVFFYYSEENLKKFKENNEVTSVYLLDEIKILRNFMFSNRAKKTDINEGNVVYVQWNLDEFKATICDDVTTKIAKELYEDQNYSYGLVNFQSAIKTCREKILVFRDLKQSNFPDHFVKIEFTKNFDSLKDWFREKGIIKFDLRNTNLFKKIPSVKVKGAVIYLEKETNRYWHLDTFHTYTEYEVYDSSGNHIGTANETGIINLENKVKDRKIHF